jgi:hypothetical protein
MVDVPRNEVTPRLLGKFHMIWLTALSDGSMTRIFDAILGGFLASEVPSLTSLSLPLGTNHCFLHTTPCMPVDTRPCVAVFRSSCSLSTHTGWRFPPACA